jgi:hypothetical protein
MTDTLEKDTFKFTFYNLRAMSKNLLAAYRKNPDTLELSDAKLKMNAEKMHAHIRNPDGVRREQSILSRKEVELLVERLQEQGCKLDRRAIIHRITYNWSKYVLKIAKKEPERIIRKQFNANTVDIGFYHINPKHAGPEELRGKPGGFVSANAHFHLKDKNSLIVCPKSRIIGNVVLVGKNEIYESSVEGFTHLNNAHIKMCRLSESEIFSATMINVSGFGSIVYDSTHADSFFIGAKVFKTCNRKFVWNDDEYALNEFIRINEPGASSKQLRPWASLRKCACAFAKIVDAMMDDGWQLRDKKN